MTRSTIPIVACLDVFEPPVRAEIEAVNGGEFDIRFATTNDYIEHLTLAREADVLLVGGAPVDARMIAAASGLKLIQKWGIGVDKIDLDAARGAGVAVTITAGANAGPVAELAIALMLALYRRLPEMDRGLREGRWMKSAARASCFQITGKTVGLIGFGAISRMVAQRLLGFDTEIIYSDPSPADAAVEHSLRAKAVDLRTLLQRSDIISLHVPLTPATQRIIGAEALAQMKPGAILINTARGGLIDEAALYQAILSGKLRGAGLDTFENEPLAADSPLLTLTGVVVTPHIGGGVLDNVANVARHALGNIGKHLKGQSLAPADLIVSS